LGLFFEITIAFFMGNQHIIDMSNTMIFFIAVGLAMDACAVSIVNGCMISKARYMEFFKIAFFFGSFQALMPVLGWFSGNYFSEYIEQFDHWIAFILLLYIGIKMIYDGIHSAKDCHPKKKIDLKSLFILSIATSIDALAIGFTFSFLQLSIIKPIIIIGGITFLET